jgi:hypothetical protein
VPLTAEDARKGGAIDSLLNCTTKSTKYNVREAAVSNVLCLILVVGDLKYYTQLLGRENMSSSWCIWCQSHPSNWKHHPLPPTEHWSIEKIKCHKEHIDCKHFKEPLQVLGIVSSPIWDFIEVENYIFPELHAEIGVVKNVSGKIENILLEFGISAAAYHGRKLNGVDCQELIKLAKPIFECTKLCCSMSHMLDGAAIILLSMLVIYIEVFVWHWTLCVQS